MPFYIYLDFLPVFLPKARKLLYVGQINNEIILHHFLMSPYDYFLPHLPNYQYPLSLPFPHFTPTKAAHEKTEHVTALRQAQIPQNTGKFKSPSLLSLLQDLSNELDAILYIAYMDLIIFLFHRSKLKLTSSNLKSTQPCLASKQDIQVHVLRKNEERKANYDKQLPNNQYNNIL